MNLSAAEEDMEVEGATGGPTNVAPTPMQTHPSGDEQENVDDDSDFIDVAQATHKGKMILNCRARKDKEKKEKELQKQTDAPAAEESDPIDQKPKVFSAG